jgi:hypothetical protein
MRGPARLAILALLAGCAGGGDRGDGAGGDPAVPEPAPGDAIQRRPCSAR